jgi:hypothetical protein
MVKRIVAGTLGAFAGLASLAFLGYAFLLLSEIRSTRSNGPLEGFLFCCLGSLIGFFIGRDFLSFAISGHRSEEKGWVRPVMLGLGSFLPGFVFSAIPLLLLAGLVWPDDDVKFAQAAELAVGVGIATAVVCTTALLKRRTRTT